MSNESRLEFGTIAPALTPPEPSVFFPEGFINWSRRPVTSFDRPNNTTQYLDSDLIGTLSTAFHELTEVANPGQLVNLNLMVVQGVLSTDSMFLGLRLLVFNKRPRPFPTALVDNSALRVDIQDVLDGTMVMPANGLDNGGGFPSVEGVLGPGLSRLDFVSGNQNGFHKWRCCVIPFQGITMVSRSLWVGLVTTAPYDPGAGAGFVEKFHLVPFAQVLK